MAKLKSQKEKDLTELTEKLKGAKSIVVTAYRGTTVKDMDTFRNTLRKEKVFSKVYKIPLVKKAMEASGIVAETVDYKEPVILSISNEDETVAARVIKTLSSSIKTFSILEGVVEGKMLSKTEIMALADLPSKDQLRAQFMSVLNGPVSAFARVLKARAEKIGEAVSEVAVEATPVVA
ncbi:MAG: 50S ribosomal protein L10 [Candidatus Doudnabacteria bacterium]|jgi:large subunit ribosomal protein L10